MLSFIGVPIVVLSVPPNFAPPTFCRTSLTARPMQRLARRESPEPSAPCDESRPASCRIGPLTITQGVAPMVVACTPCRLNGSSSMASTAASTTRRCDGSQPAITAFAATLPTVQVLYMGRAQAGDSVGSRAVPAIIAATRSAVGGINGRPSDQPAASIASCSDIILQAVAAATKDDELARVRRARAVLTTSSP